MFFPSASTQCAARKVRATQLGAHPRRREELTVCDSGSPARKSVAATSCWTKRVISAHESECKARRRPPPPTRAQARGAGQGKGGGARRSRGGGGQKGLTPAGTGLAA